MDYNREGQQYIHKGPEIVNFFLTKVTRLSENLTKVARLCEESLVIYKYDGHEYYQSKMH